MALPIPRTRRSLRHGLVLAAILAVAALVRFWGLRFGLPHPDCRPDEDTVDSVVGAIYSGTLMPHFFIYPPLYMMAVAGLKWLLAHSPPVLHALRIHVTIDSGATSTERLIARGLSAAAGVGTAWALAGAGTRLFGRLTGLAAAACFALAFLSVRESHFGVTDASMTFILTLAFLWIVKLSRSGSTRDLVAAAVLSGLAMATKYNAALLAAPAAWSIVAARSGAGIGQRIGRVAAFGALMVIVFLIVCPGAVLLHEQFLADAVYQSHHLAEGHGADLGTGLIYHLTTSLRYGLGLPVLAAGLAGLLWLVFRDWRDAVLVASFPVIYYALAGSGRTVFVRYMLPVVPFLCLAAGFFLVETAKGFARLMRRPDLAGAIATIVTLLAVWPSAWSVVNFDYLLAREDNRLIAKAWIQERFGAGTTIGQVGPFAGHVFPWGSDEVSYKTVDPPFADPGPRVLIVQSSPLAWGAPAPAADLTPMLRDRYELQFERHVADDDPRNVYDRQDEFYLPIAGFHGIERPGPNLRIYVRR